MAPASRSREQTSRSTSGFWLSKVQKSAETFNQRQFINDRTRERIDYAFTILKQAPIKAIDKTKLKQRNYQEFLRNVQTQCGDCGVLLSVIGIGSAAIGDMKKSTRTELLAKIVRQMSTLETPFLKQTALESNVENQAIARIQRPSGTCDIYQEPLEGYTASTRSMTVSGGVGTQPIPSVFELSWEDLRSIVNSSEPEDRILLFEPHGVETKPFIHFNLNEEQCEFYIAHRNRVG